MTTGTTAQVQYCATFSASCQSYYFRNFRGGSFKALLRKHEGIGRRPEVFIFKPRNRRHQESVSESRNRGEQKHQNRRSNLPAVARDDPPLLQQARHTQTCIHCHTAVPSLEESVKRVRRQAQGEAPPWFVAIFCACSP